MRVYVCALDDYARGWFANMKGGGKKERREGREDSKEVKTRPTRSTRPSLSLRQIVGPDPIHFFL